MDVAEIMPAVYDPELLVAGGEVQNLFVVGENDECGEAQFGAHGNDLFARVGHDARAFTCCSRSHRRVGQQPKAGNRREEILSEKSDGSHICLQEKDSVTGNHGRASFSISASRPFSNPYFSNASLRFWLS